MLRCKSRRSYRSNSKDITCSIQAYVSSEHFGTVILKISSKITYKILKTLVYSKEMSKVVWTLSLICILTVDHFVFVKWPVLLFQFPY